MDRSGFVRRAESEYLMQTWQTLFGAEGIPKRRRMSGLRGTLVSYVQWLGCIPVMLRLAAVLCGKTCHSAVLAGELTDRYPEFPIWLKKCWGITLAQNIRPQENEYDELRIADILSNSGCDTVLLLDDASGREPFCAVEKCARESGVSVIYVEQRPERGIRLLRREMRKCVNSYMSIVLGEEPLRTELINTDAVF